MGSIENTQDKIDELALNSGKTYEEVVLDALRLYHCLERCIAKGLTLALLLPDKNADPELNTLLESIIKTIWDDLEANDEV